MGKTQITCASCGQTYQLSEEQAVRMAGRTTTCRKCNHGIVIPEPVGLVAAVATGGGLQPPPTPIAPTTASATVNEPQRLADELINRVAAPAHTASAPAPIDYRSPGTPQIPGIIELPGAITPQIALLPGERILDQFSAGFLDLGPIGYILRHQRRLVLTTHRLIAFDKKLLSNALQVAWLPAVSVATAGQLLSPKAIVVGALLVLWGMATVVAAANSWRGVQANDLMMALVWAGIGAIIILLARAKVLLVNADGDKVAIKLTRLKSEESKRFLDGVFLRLAELRAETARH